MAAGNELTVIGNITSDPDLKILPSGVAIATFGLAWNRRFQQDGEWQEEPHFFDVTVWRDMAENVVESFSKGDRVIVVGRLEQSRWEDKESGQSRSKVGITADEVGPSLRWATAQVTKAQGDSGGRQERGRSGGGRSGGGGGRGRDDDRGGRSGGGRGRGDRDDRYSNEDPF
jgi:single-strand DNA-binding protein